MRCILLCVGRLKEKYFVDAAAEYAKRLSRFGGIDIIECPDLPEPKNASPADTQKIVRLEGVSLLAKIEKRDHVIALSISGKQMDSETFAARLSRLEDSGAPRCVFLIGGSNGLSLDALRRADEALSFSAMTFPHQLARIMLLEQLYRARKILANEAYHK